MKTKFYLLFCHLIISIPAFALDFHKNARLYDHLCEVNAEWRKTEPAGVLLESTFFSSDRQRIQKHLELVEQTLRTRDVSTLSPSQLANRLHHLDVLRDYRMEGIFPTNHYHTHRQPYFRDNFGVLCAVGYLIWQDGHREIVEQINAENNYGYIAELAVKYPAIGIWAQENGFTAGELAWIQPAYDPIKPDLQAWGNGGGLSAGGRINVMAKNADETKLFVAGQFTGIDGTAANSIAVWNGAAWSTLGSGITGEVYALEYEKGWNTEKLYVAGHFFLPGQPDKQNVAIYDLNTGVWQGVQTGDMQGSVWALKMYLGTLFIGGDFQLVNGVASPFTAVYNASFNSWDYWNKPFKVDGPVRDFELVGSFMLAGGDFKKVYQENDNAWINAPYLAYYTYSGEWLPLPHNLPPVYSLAYYYGNIFTGHYLPEAVGPSGQISGINILKGGLWFDTYLDLAGDATIHGFLPLDDHLIAYGGFSSLGMVGSIGSSVFTEGEVYSGGYLLADNTIRSIMNFKEHIYLAGDFQHLFGDPYPGLARIHSPSVSVHSAGAALPVQITAASDHLTMRYESLEQQTQLTLYDLQGRLIEQQVLKPGDMETTIDAGSNWANGLYVWQLQNTSGARSGKWAVMR
ncbi:MAG: T9SS type A sorting domain-containing protein [Saprospiraceae bacterium]|nr:T9SS type A sorting domain-containing protein [Saprospiraceae bacterium]